VALVGNPEFPDIMYVPMHFSGDVRVINKGTLLPDPLLHVDVRQDPPGREQGLLSIVLGADFTTTHMMYVFYSAADPAGQSRIDEFNLTDSTHAKFVRKIYDQPHANVFHNGGTLQFGKDKLLYMSVGDNQSSCGPSCAQQPEGLYGRIRRIDLSAADPNTSAKTFQFGLRNPWRWSFDPLTYDVVIGDVGDGGPTAEKLFFSASNDSEGRNWGWAPGTLDNRTPRGTIATLATNGGTIIGGMVYRGTNPKMAGACGIIFFGHLKGQIYTIKSDGTGMTMQTALSGTSDFSSFGRDANGELYMTHIGGQVYRIDAN
jgi:hypothetical protein